MDSLNQNQLEAARAFIDAAIEALKDEKGVHVETAIAGLSRMAGTFLFRSFNLPAAGIEPGQAVLCEQANEQGPMLIQLLGAVLSKYGVVLDGETAEPGDAKPALSFLETQRLLEPLLDKIKGHYGFSNQDAAFTAAVSAGMLIHRCAEVLDPRSGFAIAAYGFVEGAKTAPDPVVL